MLRRRAGAGGHQIVAGYRRFQKGARDVPCAFAQFAEKGTVVHEPDPEAFGYAEDPVSLGDFLENVGQQPLAVFDDPLLVAGRAKMAAFARKRREIFVAAMVASAPGEAASQVAAVQKEINNFSRSCGTGCLLGFEACSTPL